MVEVDPHQQRGRAPTAMLSRDLSMAARPPFTRGAARAARAFGSRSPSARASRMARAVFVLASDETADEHMTGRPRGASPSLPIPGAVADQLEPGAGQVAQRPDLRRRHERRPQQAHLRQPGDPLGVEPVGLRPPRQLPAWEELTSCTARPADSSRKNHMRQ